MARFLAENHVLSLAVVTDDEPWAASCFYAVDEDLSLIVMSSLETRHGAAMRDHARIAGTIAGQPSHVLAIRGIQFSATAVLLEGEARDAARSLYCQRHPVARLMRSEVWRLVLDTIKYTDNSRGPANKLHWTRNVA